MVVFVGADGIVVVVGELEIGVTVDVAVGVLGATVDDGVAVCSRLFRSLRSSVSCCRTGPLDLVYIESR